MSQNEVIPRETPATTTPRAEFSPSGVEEVVHTYLNHLIITDVADAAAGRRCGRARGGARDGSRRPLTELGIGLVEACTLRDGGVSPAALGKPVGDPCRPEAPG